MPCETARSDADHGGPSVREIRMAANAKTVSIPHLDESIPRMPRTACRCLLGGRQTLLALGVRHYARKRDRRWSLSYVARSLLWKRYQALSVTPRVLLVAALLATTLAVLDAADAS